MKSLLQFIFGLTCFLCCIPAGFGQKVAIFNSGTPGARDYEEFVFRSDKKIEYTHGPKSKPLTVPYLAVTSYKGYKSFLIKLNKVTLFVIPQNDSYLYITDGKKHYNKEFLWKYEGPVDGKGKVCNSCTQSAEEAIKLIRQYYL